MRRMMVVVAATALLMAGTPASTIAAPPDRVSDTQTNLVCELASEAGTVGVFVGISEELGDFASIGFWAAPSVPFEDDPTWIGLDGSVELSASGTQLNVTMELYEFVERGEEEPLLGDPVGTATLEATLTAIGSPEDISFKEREGNRQFRLSGTSQALAVDGSLELPGDIIHEDLSGCFASHDSFRFFATNPNSYIATSDHVSLSCFWGDEESFVGLFAIADEWGTWADVFVADASGTYFGFAEEPVLTATAFDATFELVSELTDDVVGSADASASLTQGARINAMHRFGNEKIKARGEELLVDGTLTLETPMGPQTLSLNADACYAEDVRVKYISTNPNPGKGPRLANDTPDGAAPLAIGQTVRVRTGGTAQEAEEPCIVEDPEWGDHEIPLGHTVWYTVQGTGGPVTVDSAGSGFDTVMGVYTSDGTAFTQIACVDDVFDEPDFSFQARATIDTVAGVTYYVQVGGYGGTSGQLRLAAY